MGPALAAVGAVVAALFEATIASRLQVGGAQLQILFVFAVVLALSVGFEEALSWALVGGVTVDLLAGRPLGSTALSLVASAGVAAVLGSVLSRSRFLGPVIAVLVLSSFYTIALSFVTGLVHGPAAPIPSRMLIPVTVLNTVFGALVTLPFAAWRKREQERERAVW